MSSTMLRSITAENPPPVARAARHPLLRFKDGALQRLSEVNRELWLVLSLFVLAGAINFLLDSQRMVLGLYSLPTLFAAYVYGRRHATLTAVASILLVGLVTYSNPRLFHAQEPVLSIATKWFDITVWGGILIVTAYTMGTLYEHKVAHMKELRETYHGILLILQQFISNDKYTQNHSYRVSIYATRIAQVLGLDDDGIEDVRAAALLHDIGKLEVSRQILYKAGRLDAEEVQQMQHHVDWGFGLMRPVGGSLRRVLPIVLAHHDRFDGNGYHPESGQSIPLGARILSVADVYDALTSDRPYRKAMSPFEAKEIIEKGRGTEFDPAVVNAFLSSFHAGEMDIPEVLV